MKGNAKCKNFRFELPYGRLRVTHGVHLWLNGKRIVNFLLLVIEIFASSHGWGTIERNLLKSAFLTRWVILSAFWGSAPHPAGELTTLPRPPSQLGRGIPLTPFPFPRPRRLLRQSLVPKHRNMDTGGGPPKPSCWIRPYTGPLGSPTKPGMLPRGTRSVESSLQPLWICFLYSKTNNFVNFWWSTVINLPSRRQHYEQSL